MGEVYRARDPKLQRDVAIKALPPEFAADPDRIARFEREAQALAALNHPGIAGIHELLEHDGGRFLVLEYVEGETLADRVARGPIPIDDALPIATDIAEALEAAHDKNIVHRDLKPANIIVRPDGTVKVLDFGLAKAVDPAMTSPLVSQSPTMISMTTGFIVGTASYMSPEQARGKLVDKRADIWAFGAVVYEMLTGTRAFAGEDVSLTLAEVMKSEPNWSALPRDVPAHVRATLKGCLHKNPKDRLHDMADVRLLLDGAIESAVPAAAVAARPTWRRVMSLGLLGLAFLIAGGFVMWSVIRPAPLPILRSVFVLPDGQRFTNTGRQLLAVSPDGTRMAYVANSQLFLRTLSEFESKAIPGTESTGGVLNPVFSPDGESIAYWNAGDQTIKRIGLAGGAAVTVCQATRPFGMSWQGDSIVFAEGGVGISRVPDNGGKPEVVVTVNQGQLAHGPEILPDGRTILFTLAEGTTADRWDKARIVVQQVSSHERRTLIEGGSDARYVPTGHLVYASGGVVFAVPFDPKRLEIRGRAVPVLQGVRRADPPEVNSGAADFVFSAGGLLIYAPGPESIAAGARDLGFIDRQGKVERLKLPSGSYDTPRVSPDAKRVAYSSAVGNEQAVFIYELSGDSSPRRLTFGDRSRYPVWSPDGSRVAFQSDREGDSAIFQQRQDGTAPAERLTKPEAATFDTPEAWSPSGEVLLFSSAKGTDFTLSVLSLRDHKSYPFGGVKTTLSPQAAFSPDGRWVAYRDRATAGVLMQPFPATGAMYQIGAGHSPVWSSSGQEIYFLGQGQQQMAIARITTTPAVDVGSRTFVRSPPLFLSSLNPRAFDVMPDGRIIAPLAIGEGQDPAREAARIHIVANWFEELKARVPLK